MIDYYCMGTITFHFADVTSGYMVGETFWDTQKSPHFQTMHYMLGLVGLLTAVCAIIDHIASCVCGSVILS